MFKKNTAVVGFGIGHFINASSGAAVTTGTPTCKRTIDGTGGSCANAASYNTDGAVWEIDLAAGDMNGDVIILSFTLTDCLPIAYTIKTVTGVPDASGYYPADAVALSGDTTAANNLESYCDGTTPQPVNVMYWYSGAVPEPSETGVPEVDVTFVGGSAASGVATIDANVVNWKGSTAPAMTGDAYAAVGTLSTTIGTPAGADLATDVAAIKAETALIVADTGELQTDWTNGGRLDLIVDAILEDTATTIPGTLTTISGYVDCLPATWVTVPTAAAISDAVWDEASTGHTDAGKAGAQLWTDIDAILEDTATTIPATLTTISGYVDCLPASWVTVPTAVQVRTEIDSNSTQLAAIVADTNELQTDWVNGGRLDLIVDAILEDTGSTIPEAFPTNFNDLSIEAMTGTVTVRDATITAAKFGAGAITAATFAADVNAEILSYIVDDATRIDASALNTASATSIPAILADTGTDGVKLADASIGSDTFDNMTAYPLKYADQDSTKIARTGADSDTLETISDEIAAVKAETASILEDTGTTIDTIVDSIKATTDKLDTIIEVIP